MSEDSLYRIDVDDRKIENERESKRILRADLEREEGGRRGRRVEKQRREGREKWIF